MFLWENQLAEAKGGKPNRNPKVGREWFLKCSSFKKFLPKILLFRQEEEQKNWIFSKKF